MLSSTSLMLDVIYRAGTVAAQTETIVKGDGWLNDPTRHSMGVVL